MSLSILLKKDKFIINMEISWEFITKVTAISEVVVFINPKLEGLSIMLLRITLLPLEVVTKINGLEANL